MSTLWCHKGNQYFTDASIDDPKSCRVFVHFQTCFDFRQSDDAKMQQKCRIFASVHAVLQCGPRERPHKSSYDIDVSIQSLGLLSAHPGVVKISGSVHCLLWEDALEWASRRTPKHPQAVQTPETHLDLCSLEILLSSAYIVLLTFFKQLCWPFFIICSIQIM